MAGNALERVLQSGRDTSLSFTFTPSGSGSFKVKLDSAYPEYPIIVFRDGVNITDQLSADNELALSEITAATDIKVIFDGTESFILQSDKTVLVPGESVKITAAIPASSPIRGLLYIVTYVDGKMAGWQSYNVTGGEVVKVPVTIAADATEVKAFLWDAETYVPLIKDVSVK
jgi:hypothetical protein